MDSIKITAWYLNPERITQLIGTELVLGYANKNISGKVNVASEGAICRSLLKEELEKWLTVNQVTPFEVMLHEGNMKAGNHFTLYHDFYGKGLSNYSMEGLPLPRDVYAEIYTKFNTEYNYILRIIYSPNHLTSDSAWGRLGGRTRLFSFCYIEDIRDNEIIARPYIIGDLHSDCLICL